MKSGIRGASRDTGKETRVLGLGLTAENLLRLRAGQPIHLLVSEVFPELHDLEIAIIYGDKPADIRAQLAPMLGPETEERFPGARSGESPR